MPTLQELRDSKAKVIEEQGTMIELCDAEDREMSEDEEKRYGELETELTDFDTSIEAKEARNKQHEERKAKLVDNKAELEVVIDKAPEDRSVKTRTTTKADEEATGGFRNMGEFMATMVENKFDKRLQQMKNGVTGGFNIPEKFSQELLEIEQQGAIIRPRATVLAAGDPPDARLIIPALDQTADQNMYGGVQMFNQGESDTFTETAAEFRQVQLEPSKITGYMTATNELLNNWSAASAFFPQIMRKAMTAKEDVDFLSGNGVGKAKGILNVDARIDYNRATADQISYTDILNMYAQAKLGGSLVWIASQSIIPQLGTIADANGNNLFIQSVDVNIPATLFGIPIVFNERSPVLGARGDLMLTDLSFYMIKDGSGPTIDVSEHVRFQNDEVAFRLRWYVDGQSWLNEPIQLEEGSATNKVSPFMILDIPA